MDNKLPKTTKPQRGELDQQCVEAMRLEDQFMIVQGGRQKLMLVASFVQALNEYSTQLFTQMWETMAVPPHTHPTSDITGLDSTLMAIFSALSGKAPLNHTHPISQITGNFVDATTVAPGAPPIAYNGAFPVTVKATVAGGNAVFQFTQDGLAAGAAIFPAGPIPNSEYFRAEEGVNPHAFGAAVWSNGNKTLTVPVNRTGATLTVLGLTVLGQNVAANGSVIYATAWGR